MRLTLGCGLPPGRRFLGIFEEDGEVGTVTYNNAVAVSHTGNTNETTLATVTIPGGLLQANSVIEIYALFTASGGNGGEFNMFGRVYFGGTKYVESAIGDNESYHRDAFILCNNSITAQKGFPATGSDDLNGGALITSSVNTASPVDITFKAQLDRGLDTVILEGYRIKLNGV